MDQAGSVFTTRKIFIVVTIVAMLFLIESLLPIQLFS